MGMNITVEDIERRFRKLTDEEKLKAEAFISDALGILEAHYAKAHKVPDQNDLKLCKMIVANMVKRAMSAPDFMGGASVTQYSQAASPYSESFTFANPTGDLYLTKAEKKLLGLLGSKYHAFRPHVGYRGGDSHVWTDSYRT